jgi:hypothetical protein
VVSISAKQIAEKLAATPSELPSAMERVRHWTREGLLPVLGDRYPGTGRKRLYPGEALTTARILNALAEYGIGIGSTTRHPFLTAFALATEAATKIEEERKLSKKKSGVAYYLSISSVGPSQLVDVHPLKEGEGLPISKTAISTIVINLTALLQ